MNTEGTHLLFCCPATGGELKQGGLGLLVPSIVSPTSSSAAAGAAAMAECCDKCCGPDSSDLAFQKDENDAGLFECNICLEMAKEPIVTLCGHLFCWPCLFR
jgi:hypothetical protein